MIEYKILSKKATIRDKSGYTIARGVMIKKYPNQLSFNDVVYPIGKFEFVEDENKLVHQEKGWEAELE